MHRIRIVRAFLPGLLLTPLALAQTGEPDSTLYRLNKESTFQEGCFDPCECPIRMLEPLHGRLVLEPAGSDWLFRTYHVRDVAWRAGRAPGAVRIRGSGTYRVGGEFAAQHQLTLDLQIDDGPVERFDSGLVLGGGRFPRIDIVISRNGVFCYDRVIEVHARPAPDVRVGRETLEWLPVVDATGFDVVAGDLDAVRDAGGDFSAAAARCVASETTGRSAPIDETPAPGRVSFFLVRYRDAREVGSYDSDSLEQPSSRDPGITAIGGCP